MLLKLKRCTGENPEKPGDPLPAEGEDAEFSNDASVVHKKAQLLNLRIYLNKQQDEDTLVLEPLTARMLLTLVNTTQLLCEGTAVVK